MATKLGIYREGEFMKQEKFVFNHKTLSYERFKRSAKSKLLSASGIFSSILFSGFMCFLFAQHFFPSPKEKLLMRELEQLKFQYEAVNSQLDAMDRALVSLHEKDAQVHRLIFGIDPVDDEVWHAGTGGFDRFQNITPFKNSVKILRSTIEKADKLEAQLDIQRRSLDSLVALAHDRENYLASIPSIKPVEAGYKDRNIPLLSGFGMRVHPLHKIAKMHTGIDFAAPKGTTVRATGNGKVASVKRERSGYGSHIVIEHGYGYQTLYAHLSSIDVREGQAITKGQKIGSVGSSGTSTAAHLHYEVHLNGTPVDPVKYCIDGLSPAEYHELVRVASQPNKSFD